MASLVLASACASARVKRENALALAGADARVLEGCYDCLLQARATYERITAARKAKAGDAIYVRLFETDLLLAIREKELALDARATLERATALVTRLPPKLEASRVLRMVDAVVPDATGRPDSVTRVRNTNAAYVPKITSEIAWLSTAPLRAVVRDYVGLALHCAYSTRSGVPRTGPRMPRRRPELAANAPPIIAYRTGICMGTDTAMVARALAAVPAFHEAAYWIGSMAAFAADETGGEDAAKLLGQAYRRFPLAPGITFMSGWLGSVIGDCPAAVRYFDETLAIEPTHETALLERTVCLSRLRQDSAAIASATRLIDLERESLGQGYYWRALSRHRLKDLRAARSDIEVAKRRAMGPTVLTLAGVIEFDQDQLPVAERDLREAREWIRGDENCTAAWYLALVLNKSQRARESAEQFEAAMKCYDVKVADMRYKIAKIQEMAALNPTYAAKRVAALAADSVEERTRYFASAFNAAGNYANAANRTRALELLTVAANDPKLADQVATLRAAIASRR